MGYMDAAFGAYPPQGEQPGGTDVYGMAGGAFQGGGIPGMAGGAFRTTPQVYAPFRQYQGVAPQMRSAPVRQPAQRAPQMRQAPPPPQPQGPIMGMYGGGMGSGPLGRTFMQSQDMGANWQATNQGPQSGGWRQTITDPQGNGWMR